MTDILSHVVARRFDEIPQALTAEVLDSAGIGMLLMRGGDWLAFRNLLEIREDELTILMNLTR